MTAQTANLPATTQTTTRLPALPTAEGQSWLVAELREWDLAAPVPEAITPDRLSMAISNLSAGLEPASMEAFAVAMDKLMSWAEMFGIGPAGRLDGDKLTEWQAAMAAAYREGVADMPADLLMLGIERVTKGWRYPTRFPLPGDVRGAVAGGISERLVQLGRCRYAARKLGESGPRAETNAERDARLAGRVDKIAAPVTSRPGSIADVVAAAGRGLRHKGTAAPLTDEGLEQARAKFLADTAALLSREAAE